MTIFFPRCIEFQTPEECFLGEAAAPFTWGCPEPRTFVSGKAVGKADMTSFHSKVSGLLLFLTRRMHNRFMFLKFVMEKKLPLYNDRHVY